MFLRTPSVTPRPYLTPFCCMAAGLFLGLAMPGILRAAPAAVRSLFLNGVDISSAKSQDLKGVDLHISETGDVFIIAPHYQVNEEDTYVPLSKYVQGINAPEQKTTAQMAATLRGEAQLAQPAGGKPNAPAPTIAPGGAVAANPAAAPAAGGMLPKAGSMMPISAPATPPADMPPETRQPAAAGAAPAGSVVPTSVAPLGNGALPADRNPAAALGEADGVPNDLPADAPPP